MERGNGTRSPIRGRAKWRSLKSGRPLCLDESDTMVYPHRLVGLAKSNRFVLVGRRRALSFGIPQYLGQLPLLPYGQQLKGLPSPLATVDLHKPWTVANLLHDPQPFQVDDYRRISPMVVLRIRGRHPQRIVPPRGQATNFELLCCVFISLLIQDRSSIRSNSRSGLLGGLWAHLAESLSSENQPSYPVRV